MAEQADLIYKILSVADWEAAQRAGRFEGSADDRRDGFIHFSDGEQVIGTARKYFAGQSGLMLLAVDPARLADLRWERSRDDALFPHLYGPLELDAVTRPIGCPTTLARRRRHRATCSARLRAHRAAARPAPGGRSPRPAAPGMIRQLLVAEATSLARARRRSPPGRTRPGGRA